MRFADVGGGASSSLSLMTTGSYADPLIFGWFSLSLTLVRGCVGIGLSGVEDEEAADLLKKSSRVLLPPPAAAPVDGFFFGVGLTIALEVEPVEL